MINIRDFNEGDKKRIIIDLSEQDSNQDRITGLVSSIFIIAFFIILSAISWFYKHKHYKPIIATYFIIILSVVVGISTYNGLRMNNSIFEPVYNYNTYTYENSTYTTNLFYSNYITKNEAISYAFVSSIIFIIIASIVASLLLNSH